MFPLNHDLPINPIKPQSQLHVMENRFNKGHKQMMSLCKKGNVRMPENAPVDLLWFRAQQGVSVFFLPI